MPSGPPLSCAPVSSTVHAEVLERAAEPLGQAQRQRHARRVVARAGHGRARARCPRAAAGPPASSDGERELDGRERRRRPRPPAAATAQASHGGQQPGERLKRSAEEPARPGEAGAGAGGPRGGGRSPVRPASRWATSTSAPGGRRAPGTPRSGTRGGRRAGGPRRRTPPASSIRSTKAGSARPRPPRARTPRPRTPLLPRRDQQREAPSHRGQVERTRSRPGVRAPRGGRPACRAARRSASVPGARPSNAASASTSAIASMRARAFRFAHRRPWGDPEYGRSR